MSTPLTYIVVPRMEWMVLRVAGHHSNRRKLVAAVRSGAMAAARVRNVSQVLWSKARVRKEVVRA